LAGLYLHIPFRRASRTYDEAFYVCTDADSFSSYTTALKREMVLYAQQYAEEEPIETVYAGGGRASLIPMGEVRDVLQTVLEVFDASSFREATAEVNPADVDPTYLSGLQSVGFDRLHLSVLSFYPEDLTRIGTPHSAQDSVRAIREARQAGFEDLSIELLFGWPGQPMERWKANLQQAVDMDIPHLTVTEWTGDHKDFPGAPTASRDDSSSETAASDPASAAATSPSPSSPAETAAESSAAEAPDRPVSDAGGDRDAHRETDRDAEIQAAKQFQYAMDKLSDAGYTQYEITHFAQPGHASVHQRSYYDHGNYLGVGASAHTFWWPRRMQNVPARRWSNVRDVDRYEELLAQKYPPISYRQTIDWTTLGNEYVALRLRTDEGLDLRRLKAEYGYDLREKRARLLAKLEDNGLIAPTDDHRIRLTRRGRLVADGITERLVQ
jgi:oxygen-independent coproporphyrinogen-3 oxidase